MNVTNLRTARALTYAGALPFYLCAALAFDATLAPAAVAFALSYAAVIASFVCGMHWGLFIARDGAVPPNLLITSNVGALVAWIVPLILKPSLAMLVLALLFGMLLALDRSLMRQSVLPDWFWPVRRNVTGLVVLALVVLALTTRTLP